MYTINIKGIHLYGYHGCMPEEAVIGGDYVINISMDGDFSKAASNDNLLDTVDYADVYDIVKKEMGIRSNLIERVANRIAENIKATFPAINKLSVELIKKNPPVNGELDEVSVIVVL